MPIDYQVQTQEIKKPVSVGLYDLVKFDWSLPPLEDPIFSPKLSQPIVITRYQGLEGLVRRKITQSLESFLNPRLKTYWEENYFDSFEIERRKREFNLKCADAHYRWWQRSWLDSLEDGQKVFYTTEGQVSYLDLGFLRLSNEGRLSLDNWGITVEDEPNPVKAVLEEDVEQLEEETKNLALKITTPGGNLYRGRWFSVAGNLRVSLRPPSSFDLDPESWRNNKTAIRVNLIGRSFVNKKGQPWMVVSLRGVVQPFRDDYACNLIVEIFWD